jgi:GntR family transcriptional repressor for pyruvate dehydrogenase complex
MFNKIDTKKSRLYEKIIEEIESRINDGMLKKGDYMPTERELAEDFGVSRIPVREALKTLEFMGVLESDTKGMRVARDTLKSTDAFHDLFDGTDQDIFNDLLEARAPIELKSIELACKKRNTADVKELERLLQEHKASIQNDAEFCRTAKALHITTASASKNKAILRILDVMDGMLDEVREHTTLSVERREKSYDEWECIVEAIRNQDVEKAIQTMQTHLGYMTINYSNYQREEET